MRSVKQGEIYAAYIESGIPRPVVVISRESLNRGKYVVGIPFTSSEFDKRRILNNCVPFRKGEFGLTKNCVAQCEAVTQLLKEDINTTEGPLGQVSDDRMRDIIKAIGFVFLSDCEPSWVE